MAMIRERSHVEQLLTVAIHTVAPWRTAQSGSVRFAAFGYPGASTAAGPTEIDLMSEASTNPAFPTGTIAKANFTGKGWGSQLSVAFAAPGMPGRPVTLTLVGHLLLVPAFAVQCALRFVARRQS